MNNFISGQPNVINKPEYSDISDNVLIMASSCLDNFSDFKEENIPPEFSTDVSALNLSRHRSPLMHGLMNRRTSV